MYLFFIVYEEVLDEEVSSFIDKIELDRYIKWDKVKGRWKEKHMGTHIWPGEYHTVLVMVEEEKVVKLTEGVKELQKKFTADEIWAWKVLLNETI